jgi:PAS domain S-box-containing protein
LTATFLSRESDDFDVITEHEPRQALDRLETDSIDCIVCDYDMPEMNGLEFLEAVREEYPDLPFILFTGKGSEEIASEAISRGVTDYLQKGGGTDQYTVLANRIQNATAQHRAEREIERRSKWYQRILEYSSDYVLIVNQMGNVSYVSPAIERVMGYTPEETLGNDSFDYIIPEDEEIAMKSFSKTIENPDKEVTVEFRGEANDGSIRWLEVRGRNFFDDPIINGVMVNVRDITARKEREREVERRNEQLEQVTNRLQNQYEYLFEQLPIMAVVTREESGMPIVEDCNDRFAATLNYRTDEIIDQPLGEFYTADSREELLEGGGYTRALEGEFTREDRELVTKDGNIVETVLRAIPRHSDSAEPEGTVALYIDITEREEAKREKERLEEFLNIVSHDLRNPLNVAEGHLELAQEDFDSADLDAVEQAHKRMKALIEDLLQLARSGNQVDELKPVELDDLSKLCWENVATADASITVDLDQTILADQSRLRQLLENLFRNAVEHGSTSSQTNADDAVEHGSGDVNITVGTLEDGFYVADNGPGISEQDREDVFESGYSTKEEGTGFGLAIVEQIVDAHDWRIAIEESNEGGARFEITNVETK